MINLGRDRIGLNAQCLAALAVLADIVDRNHPGTVDLLFHNLVLVEAGFDINEPIPTGTNAHSRYVEVNNRFIDFIEKHAND